MHLNVTRARPDDLDAMVALAVTAQASPEHFVPMLSDDADAIRADVLDAAGDDDWTALTLVARAGDQLVGWLFAERDPERGRIWWFGPCLRGGVSNDDEETIADELYRAAEPLRAGFTEEEVAYDARSAFFAAFAQRHGFQVQEGSLALRLDPHSFRPIAPDAAIQPLDPTTSAAVADLHERTFAGTHTTGEQLVAASSDRCPRWCLTEAGTVLGYVATERQNDGSLYVDYLGVEPDHQGRGVGRRLVAHAITAGLAAGASHAHLTVRSGNQRARRLYASLGFVEERELVPARKGFLIL